MGLTENILLIFISYPIIITLLAAFLGGEVALLFLAVLSGQGVMSLGIVVVFFFIGTTITDFVFFNFAKSSLVKRFLKKKLINKWYRKISSVLGKFRKNIFMVLLITKFLHGTRYISLIYFGNEKVKKSKFLIYDFFVTVIWISILFPIGWFAGKGISLYVDIFKNFQLALTLVVVVVIAFLVLRGLITKIFFGEKIS